MFFSISKEILPKLQGQLVPMTGFISGVFTPKDKTKSNLLAREKVRIFSKSAQQTFVLMKTSFVFVFQRCLQDVLIKTIMFALALRLQNTSSRRLGQDWYICLGHTSSRRLQHIFKTSSRCLKDVFKTFLRPLQDVFKTSSRRLANSSSRRFQGASSS